jgi:hypothetical protein
LSRENTYVFAGPYTDDKLGSTRRHDNVHFNEAGLREHAARRQTALDTTGAEAIPDPVTLGLLALGLTGLGNYVRRRFRRA